MRYETTASGTMKMPPISASFCHTFRFFIMLYPRPRGARPRSRHERLDARGQPPGLDRFENVVVDARLEPLRLAFDARFRGQHQDADLRHARIEPQRLDHVDAAHPRH